MAVRRCEGCGDPLSARKRADARWCSRQCYYYYRYPKPFLDAERKFLMSREVCRSCGTPLSEARRFDAQFCSQRCRQREYRMRIASGFGTDPKRPAAAPPGHADLNAGKKFMRRRLWEDARSSFARAIELDEEALSSDHPSVGYDRWEMGHALHALGCTEEALEHFAMALEIAEGSADHAGSVSLMKRVVPSLVALSGQFDEDEVDARWQNQMDSILLKRERKKAGQYGTIMLAGFPCWLSIARAVVSAMPLGRNA